MKHWLALTLVLAAFLSGTAFAEQALNSDAGINTHLPWSLSKNKTGIQVYTRPDPSSPLDEFKGVTELTARLSSLVALVRDTDNTKKWMHRSGGTQVLERVNSSEQILRTITLSPWPVSDRDVVLRATQQQHLDTLTITISLQSIDGHSEKRRGYVRMPSLVGKWVFQPLKEGVVRVSYQVRANPGGSIPAWLAGDSSIDMPFQTLKNMRAMLEEPAYADATVEAVIEP